MGFHYPFFTFGDWAWSVLCFAVVLLAAIWVVSCGCGRCGRHSEVCEDCGEDPCDCNDSEKEKVGRVGSRKRSRNDREI